jgi:hypothetical protein
MAPPIVALLSLEGYCSGGRRTEGQVRDAGRVSTYTGGGAPNAADVEGGAVDGSDAVRAPATSPIAPTTRSMFPFVAGSEAR